jgi:phage-related minor tail protein
VSTRPGNVSLPQVARAPRALDDEERATITRVADVLVPARGAAPPASAEPGFWSALATALDARSDAFADVVDALHHLAPHAGEELWERLRALDAAHPSTFQALSTVVAGAWLLTPGVRARIGYHGQQSDKAGIEEAADELTSGVLDPVIDRDPEEGPRWIR